jgi:hypothetical protein
MLSLGMTSRYTWLVISAFFLLMILSGCVFGRRYLKQAIPRSEFPRLERSQVTCFTLAGFSLTAMTLFAAFFSTDLSAIRGTLGYLSLALVLFLVAAYLVQIRINVTSYMSETFELTGILAIGAAFLEFFSEQMPWAFELVAIYWAMFLAVFLLGVYFCKSYVDYWRKLNDK